MYSSLSSSPAVVADIGEYSSKIGFAGADAPEVWFPTLSADYGASAAASSATDNLLTAPGAFDLFTYQPDIQLQPILSDGLISDWDAYEAMWTYNLKERLKAISSEHAVVVSEHEFTPKADRERLFELMFEKFNTPAVFSSKQSVLSCYANARTTALIIDIGGNNTTITPVQDGFALLMGVRKGYITGRVMDDFYNKCIAAKGTNIAQFYSVEKNAKAQASTIKIAAIPDSSASFREYHIREIMRQLKETVCRVSDTPFDYETSASVPNIPYELPDGNMLYADADRFRVPELLFAPQPVLDKFPGAQSLQDLVTSSLMTLDPELRSEIMSNIVLVGGGGCFPGLADRLTREINKAGPPGTKAKIVSGTPVERRLAAWIGGSIVGSLEGFDEFWVSKQEYKEHGGSIAHKKCP